MPSTLSRAATVLPPRGPLRPYAATTLADWFGNGLFLTSAALFFTRVVGLTPAQVVAMVLASIVPIGIVAGLVGVLLGLVAQRAVLSYMGEVAAKTGIPPAIFDVFSPAMFVVLGLAGLAIGAAGAYLPAQRAARARIAPVLQAE